MLWVFYVDASLDLHIGGVPYKSQPTSTTPIPDPPGFARWIQGFTGRRHNLAGPLASASRQKLLRVVILLRVCKGVSNKRTAKIDTRACLLG